jgi:GDPmannose 4,6-dehydratase
MLQQEKSDDYVIGTGESHSVKDFVQAAFSYANLDWEKYVAIDPRYFRPTEVADLCADASKAKRQLDWKPQVNFFDLVAIMVDADMEAVGLAPIGQGQNILAAKFSYWHQWSSAVTSLHQNPQSRFE